MRTVFLTTPGTRSRLEGDALRIERPDEPFVRIPLRQIDDIVVHGRIEVSTALMHRLATEGIGLTMLSRSGRFVCRMTGPTAGNVLLRQSQFASAATESGQGIAREIVGAKLLNSRVVLLDAARERQEMARQLRSAAERLASYAERARSSTSLDELRGLEGNGAKTYFAEFDGCIGERDFAMSGRTRRPPLDPTNCLLSYIYALLRIRCVGALESIGLDPQIGFLHAVRPGRPALALDVMEEFRAPFADRHVLTLINRRQMRTNDFVQRPGGSWELSDEGRRKVLQSWDTFLDVEVPHRVYGHRMQRRHVPHFQALLMARHLRGDLDHYLPFRSTPR